MDLPSHLDRLPSAALQQQAARSDLKIIKYINMGLFLYLNIVLQ